MKTIGAVLAMAAAVGFGFVPAATQKPVPQATAMQQPLQANPFSGLTLTQMPPQGYSAGTIHVSVTGAGPVSGNYMAHEQTTGSPGTSYFVTLVGMNGQIRAQIFAGRTIDTSGNPVWNGCVQLVNLSNDGVNNCGAYSGNTTFDILGNPHYYGGMIPLSGADFNCSGSLEWLGSPTFGAQSTVTLSVSP